MGRTGNGVEPRANSIRIKLTHLGVTVRETLTVEGGPIPPTPANLKYATRVAADIRRRISLGTFNLADFFPQSPRAKAAAAEADTLGALLDTWLKSKGTLSAATRDQYATAVRFWKRELGASTPLAALTHKHLAAKIGGYPWPSAKTHNNYLIALRGALALEFRGAKQAHNPLVGIDNMTAVKKLPDPLQAGERDRILADMRKHYPDQVVAYFLWQFFTGMRPEETIALRWSDVDTKRQTVRVQRVRTFKGTERDGSKTHTVRDVDLLPQALEALQLMKPHTAMLRAERKGDDDTSADIFQHPVTGRPWHDERSQRDTYWRPSLKRQGVRWRTAYATRHTYATCALMAGVPPAYIAAQLGHGVKMLLDRYARWIPGADGGGAKAMLAAAMSGDSSLKSPQAGKGA